MAKYYAVYKCPICNTLIKHGDAHEVPYEQLPRLLGKFMSTQQFSGNPYLDTPPMQIPHKCKDGSAGLATFAGFLKS